jgi:predicted  nucleic acid-binding Zn-ribbon protein
MIAEKDLVTKKYLKTQLDPIKSELASFRKEMKGEIGGIHGEFAKIRSEMKEQKIEIVEELRAEIYQSMESVMRNMKSHYDKEIHRTIMASVENIRDENRAFRDGITMLIEKTNDHDRRLEAAGI